MRIVAVLIVETGPKAGQRRWIRLDESLSVGSSDFADFVVDGDPEMAPLHFVVSLTGEGCAATSVGLWQLNVNGINHSAAELMDGDLITIGRTRFSFRLQQSRIDPRSGKSVVRSPTISDATIAGMSMRTEGLSRIECRQHDSKFLCFSPREVSSNDSSAPPDRDVDAYSIAKRIATRVPLFFVCQFDSESLPQPDGLEDCDSVHHSLVGQGPRTSLLCSAPRLLAHPKIVANGFDQSRLVGIASTLDEEETLMFLRSHAMVYADPPSLQNVLAQTAEMATHLGPLSGILLGTFQQWVFLVDQQLIADSSALGYSDRSSV